MSATTRDADAGYYRDLLRPVFSGRRFLLVGGAVVPLAALGRELVGLGADTPFLLGSTCGLGELPAQEEQPWCSLDRGGSDIMHAMWSYEAGLAEPEPRVRAAVDAWDPEGRALATGYILMSDLPRVAGRARFAYREPRWVWLEDKTRVHGLFDRLDVRRGPLAITRADPRCLRAAHARLDRGAGTVWAGDLGPGLHGGGSFVRWVYDEATAEEACELLAPVCERARIMPFVEGVPCSVHGLVAPETAAEACDADAE